MTDIVERLRETYPSKYAFTELVHIGYEASDEIETLRNRVKELEDSADEYKQLHGFAVNGFNRLAEELATLKQSQSPLNILDCLQDRPLAEGKVVLEKCVKAPEAPNV